MLSADQRHPRNFRDLMLLFTTNLEHHDYSGMAREQLTAFVTWQRSEIGRLDEHLAISRGYPDQAELACDYSESDIDELESLADWLKGQDYPGHFRTLIGRVVSTLQRERACADSYSPDHQQFDPPE